MKNAIRVLIIGAGVAGQMVAEEIRRHPEANCQCVAFIDDDPIKKGRTIAGLPVIGGQEDIFNAVNDGQIDEIFIAIPSADGQTIRGIIDHCEKTRVGFKIVPGIFEIIKGDVQINHIREIHPEDLLGRETVSLDTQNIAAYLKNKTVLVTGGGGSIGSEISRQVASFSPASLILFCRGENSLFNIENELKESYPTLNVIPLIGDISDEARVNHVLEIYQPEVIFHAAAHKHVVIMEANPTEAVKNNIFGTQVVADAACRHQVERFIMLSTDKAVNPTSVMGVTKRIAELYVQRLAQTQSRCKFMTVRFGNVIGSRGSVVPLFLDQIKKRRPLTITDPEAVRYFMTISEAAQLVLQAGAIGEGGEIFVLDMGQPIKIGQLARQLIILAGFDPELDIPVRHIGLRRGEKLKEQLMTASEGLHATRHQKIFQARPNEIDHEFLVKNFSKLHKIVARHNHEGIMAVLREIVPDYSPD